MAEREGQPTTGDGRSPVAGPGLERRPPALGPGPEFDLIRRFLAGGREGMDPRIKLGAGDDAAVLEGGPVVVSTDLVVEQVHFRREWISPIEIGFRAASAAISDLAAMAASPIGVLASLAVAESEAESVAPPIMDGVREAIEELGGELLGGDLTRSPGPVILDVVALGEAERPILRGGARAGDEIWVSGELGGAGAAVRSWLAGREPLPSARERFAAPRPRVREALWLARQGVPRAMLDLSDGLGGDVGHLARAAGLAAVILAARVPIHPAAAEAGTGEEPLFLALAGGEDYEICFAARPGSVLPYLEEFMNSFGLPLTCVGRFEEGEGVFLENAAGQRTPFDAGGFQHFRREG